jgi:dimethylargininase
MKKFTRAIVRRPGPEIINGLSTTNLGKPDYHLAFRQHGQYIKSLMACGLEVTVLEPDSRYADATFVEDTALLTPECAIIMNPGVSSRKGETEQITSVVRKFYDHIEIIEPPGTIEAGDIMMVGTHYYIGLSKRTNRAGAQQVIEILQKCGLNGSIIELKEVLHLKTGVSYLENNHLLAAGEFLNRDELRGFKIIPVDKDESYAANSIWVNDVVIMPAGYAKTKKAVSTAGYDILEVNTSEFRKIDGGVSCLSLRF